MKKLMAILLAVVMLLPTLSSPVFTVDVKAEGGYTWTRVTSIDTLLAGGEFIIGYEATANSGVIIPMANTGTATTSKNGFMYSGAAASSGNTTTLNMTTYADEGTAFIVTIAQSTTTGNITIKAGDNYIGKTGTSNDCRLYASDSKETVFTPTIDENGIIKLQNANSTNYYLQYNSSSPRFCCYKGAQKNLVIYKRAIAEIPHKHSYVWNRNVGVDGSHTLTCANTDDNCDALTTTEGCTWEGGFCSVCGATAPECAHTNQENVAAIPATCTEIGYTAGVKCTDCNAIISGIEEIAALNHNLVTDAAVSATCTETGLTEGSHCDRDGCGHIEVAQEETPALGHNYVGGVCDREGCEAEAPLSYTFDYTTGTNGTAASNVTEGLVTLTFSKGTGNNAPTWYTSGTAIRFYANNTLKINTVEGYYIKKVTYTLTQGSDFTADSGSITSNAWTPANNETVSVLFTNGTGGQIRVKIIDVELAAVCHHTNKEAIGEAKDATCTEDGITAGEKCSACGEIITAQETISAKGHSFVDGVCANEGCGEIECDHVDKGITLGDVTKEASCTETGLQEQFCAQCNQPLNDKVLDKAAHTPVTDVAVAPTCIATGLTEGSHCSVCNEVLVEQTVVNMAAHNYAGGVCSVCGDIAVSGDKLADFQFGENGEGSKESTTEMKAGVVETSGAYKLDFTNVSKVYNDSRDALGNSVLKLGTGSATGSFTFEVPSNVNAVVIYVAGRQTENVNITVNEVSYTIKTHSNDGKYTKIVIDTTENKTVNFSTVADGNDKRCMVNSIEYWGVIPKISGASINLTTSLALNYYISNGNGLYYSVNDGEWKLLKGDTITYSNISPSNIATEITVKLGTENGATVYDTKTYSIKAYCDDQLNIQKEKAENEQDTKLIALCKALLNFGSASQKKYLGMVSGFANGNGTDGGAVYDSTADNRRANVINGTTVNWYSAQLVLNDSIDFRFKFNINDGYTIDTIGNIDIKYGKDGSKTANENDYKITLIGDNQYLIRFNSMSAADLLYNVTVTIGDATLTYSTAAYANYINAKYRDSTDVNAYHANTMMEYIVAVDEYANK